MNELKNIQKKIKGYGFDSLVFRYKIARESQARAETKSIYNGDENRARTAANRDLMRFIEILNDLIGDHE